MSTPPSEPRSAFGTPNFPFQVNSQGTSDESRMPGYHFFRQATCDFSQIIGRGQLGKVYKAHFPTGEVVVVKLLYQMTRFDDEGFLDKCTELMSANHKNIVRLLGYSYEEHEESHVYYGTAICGVYIRRLIGFEYVPGGNLSNFISDQRLGWSIRFKIIKGICEGLQYLHEAGIVHSNLTPGNILLDDEKIPKITDFGLSRMFKPVNERAAMKKTTPYDWLRMLAKGGMSQMSDIFSLGALIKIILTGSTEDSTINCMDGPECVEHVYRYWRKRLQEIRRYPSFQADCKQVRICIEIAEACMHNDQLQRPLIGDIVRKLYEVEAKGEYPSSHIELDIHDFEAKKMSLKELEQITSNFSEKLDQDGCGAVYKGKRGDGEVIAVKRFDERLRKLEEQFDRVVNLMRLKHKNIVRLTGYCYEPTQVPVPDDTNPGKTMWWDIIENLVCYEFLPNGNLDMILNDKSCDLNWQTRHKIIHGICEGLHHLHVECQDAPIVHQGIKPTNILLDDGMVPKLGDFYTSMAVTPRCYIAPESMDTGKITVKSNIYSLGVMILEILTGDKCRGEESSSRSYIENVLKSRKQNSYVKSKYPSLEAGFVQQVESWIIIGLKCVEIQPESRPTIGQIMHFLNTESANAEFYHWGEFRLSSESTITLWPFSEMADHASEVAVLESMLSDASVEPTRLSYSLIKSITRNFSQVIGRGGYGVVYLGFLPNGRVAVKKLSVLQEFSDDQFLDEIKCLKKAKHNNIVRFLGYCADSHGELLEFNGRNVIAEVPQRLLCFEYVPNGNLQYYIKEKSHGDSWQIRYQLIKGICLGLQYLHNQRINHLDLKPENILVDAEMEPKITDFGLSRFFDEGQSRQFTKIIRGTLGWMAPEIINNGEMSFKSDIYGLGNIIIKLLTRNNDYDFENWRESLVVGCSQEERCVEIARKCVKYDQYKRPTIEMIVHMLNETENTIQDESSPVIQQWKECPEYDQHERPTMDDIMQEMNEMENTIQGKKPSVVQKWRKNLSSLLKGHWRQRKDRN